MYSKSVIVGGEPSFFFNMVIVFFSSWKLYHCILRYLTLVYSKFSNDELSHDSSRNLLSHSSSWTNKIISPCRQANTSVNVKNINTRFGIGRILSSIAIAMPINGLAYSCNGSREPHILKADNVINSTVW